MLYDGCFEVGGDDDAILETRARSRNAIMSTNALEILLSERLCPVESQMKVRKSVKVTARWLEVVESRIRQSDAAGLIQA